MAKQCPKCGHIRGPGETAPDWQCPACGIAYHKYAAYLENVKHIAKPRKVTTVTEPLAEDGSIWSLIVVNVFVLNYAWIADWRLIDMMLVYWVQSMVIGFSYFLRILSLDKFSMEGMKVDDRLADATPAMRNLMAIFFAFHFSAFHSGYMAFMLDGAFGDPRLGPDLLLCAAAFAVNHAYSYRYHRDRDRQGAPDLGKMMKTPYARILPMHLIIMFGAGMAGSAGGVLIFGILKTFADVSMHQHEHKLIASKKGNEN